MGVCTKERKGVTATVLMATPCTNSLVYNEMMMFLAIPFGPTLDLVFLRERAKGTNFT